MKARINLTNNSILFFCHLQYLIIPDELTILRRFRHPTHQHIYSNVNEMRLIAFIYFKQLMNEHKTLIVYYVPSTIRDELRYLTAFNKETSLVVDISFSGEPLLRFWQLKTKRESYPWQSAKRNAWTLTYFQRRILNRTWTP